MQRSRRHLLLVLAVWLAWPRAALADDPPANPSIRAVVLSSPGTRRFFDFDRPWNLPRIWFWQQVWSGYLPPESMLKRPTARATFDTLVTSEEAMKRRLYLGNQMPVTDGAILFPLTELGWDKFHTQFGEFLTAYNRLRPGQRALTVDDLAFYRAEYWSHGVPGVPDPRAEQMHAVMQEFVIDYARRRSGKNQLAPQDLTLVTNYYSGAFMSGLEGHGQFLEDPHVPATFKALRVVAICGDPGVGFSTIEYRLDAFDRRMRASATARPHYGNLSIVILTGNDTATALQHMMARPFSGGSRQLPANTVVVEFTNAYIPDPASGWWRWLANGGLIVTNSYVHNHVSMWHALLGPAADGAQPAEPEPYTRALRALLYFTIVREGLPLTASELLADKAWDSYENPLKTKVRFRSSTIDAAVEATTRLRPIAVYELLAWASTIPEGQTEPVGMERALLVKRLQIRLQQRVAAPTDAPFVYTADERAAFTLVTGAAPTGAPKTDHTRLHTNFVTRYTLRPAARPRR
jgi:hypothetical protein